MGFWNYETVFSERPAVMVQLSLIAVWISSPLSFIPTEVWQTHSSKGSLTISRCAAIVFILFWLGIVGLPDKGAYNLPNEIYGSNPIPGTYQVAYRNYDGSYDMQPWPEPQIKTRPRAWRAWVYRSLELILYIGLLAFLQDSLVTMLLEFSSRFRVLFCLFGVPLLLKPRLYIDVVLSQGVHGRHIDDAIRPTLVTGFCIGLFVGPLLVIVGWIISSPVTLASSSFELTAYVFTFWIFIFFVQVRKRTWYGRSLLVGMYIILALWPVIYI